MKNYTALLTDDDTNYLCHIIGGKLLREMYKKNPISFNKIKSVRPGNLSNEDAYAFAIENRNVIFMSQFFNAWIDDRMKEIEEAFSVKLREENKEEIALADTLSKSVFDKRPQLYFSLADKEPSIRPDLFFYLVDLIRENTALKNSEEIKEDKNEESSEKDSLFNIRNEYIAEISTLKGKHEKELASEKLNSVKLHEQIGRLENELRSTQEETLALQRELNEYRVLTSYEIKETQMIPSEEYDYLSLCRVYINNSGRTKLRRLADVKDGLFTSEFLAEAPDYNSLFWFDGPNKKDFIGVWDWKVIPSSNDPSKDYIKTTFNPEIQPIEMIVIQECHSINDLVEKVKGELSETAHMERLFLAFKTDAGYEGIYCDKDSFIFQSGKVTLQPSVLKLPIYEISDNSFIKTDNLFILEKTGLGTPKKLLSIKDPIEIIQNMIVNKVTWQVSQQSGFVKKEYQRIKEFLSELSTTDFYEEISHICDCTVEEAKENVDDFIKRADKVISGHTMENTVMAQIIKNDPTLYNASLEEIRNDWEKDNQEKIEFARSKIEILKNEEIEQDKRCNEKQELYNTLEQKINEANKIIADQEQLAREVEEKVIAKIEQARDNAAEFIAENAFIHPNKKESSVGLINEEDSQQFVKGKDFETESPENNENYGQLLETIQDELIEAGVDRNSVIGLSAVLYSAYINRIPLLLAGPGGNDIAIAFSIALNCRYPAILKCEGVNFRKPISECIASKDDLVIIEQPLQPVWEHEIISLISNRMKFFILVHPFAEDLVIEPRGLFNYCVPIFTELFVNSIATRNYFGGNLTKNFGHFINKESRKNHEKLLNKMRVSSIAKNNIQSIISDVHKMLNVEVEDTDYCMLLYPLAVALGEMDILNEYLTDKSNNIGENMRSKLLQISGEKP